MPGQWLPSKLQTQSAWPRLVILGIMAAGCAASPGSSYEGETSSGTPSAVAASPAERTVAVATSGCGDAADSIGSGVIVGGTTTGDDLVVTSAHVVAGAEQVWILPASSVPKTRSWPDFSPGSLAIKAGAPSTVLAIDTALDVALIESPIKLIDRGDTDLVVPELVNLSRGTEVTILGLAVPDPSLATVLERTRIVADEVRGTGRVERLAYRLEATTATGDSGAGVWLGDQLGGIVFAVSANATGESWAVAGSEIAATLDAYESRTTPATYTCVPELSRLQQDSAS